jgi:hypothetical protein
MSWTELEKIKQKAGIPDNKGQSFLFVELEASSQGTFHD